MKFLRERMSKKTCSIKMCKLFRPMLILIILSILMGPFPISSKAETGFKSGPPPALWDLRNWGRTFGGEANEEAFSMGNTADGGCILAGVTYSFPSSSGYEDAWVLKLGPEGSVEWEKSYGNVFWDSIRTIQQTQDGGYIGTGTHYPPDGSQEAWVIKLNPHGEIDWQFTYGRADYYDSAWSIEQTLDGGYIVCGGTQSYAIGGEQGAWVLKLTESGVIEWQKFLGGAEYDYLFSGDQTADGGYILAGGTYSYAPVPWYSNVWLVKMFPNGDIDWEKSFGGPYSDVAYSVKQIPDGGYVLACWTSYDRGDVLILKTDPHGNLDWQKRYGGERGDVPTSMRLARDGGILIAGYTDSFGFVGHDGWVFKLGGDGKMKWQKTFGGDQDDAFNEIVETPFGYTATGYTQSFGAGEKDFWCIHFTPFGPGTHFLKSITRPAHAVLKPVEVTEYFISVSPRDTHVAPVSAQTTAFTTSSYQTDLVKALPNKEGISNRASATLISDAIPLPIQANSDRGN